MSRLVTRFLFAGVLMVTAVAVAAFAPGAGADGNEAPLAPAAARSITTGTAHTCTLLDNGTVTCWGAGGFGRLGQDSTVSLGDQSGEMAALDPVDLGLGRTATAITAGSEHTCALLDDATVKCWGEGSLGALGQDSTASLGDQSGEMAALDPIDLGVGRTATAVTAGGGYTCALLDDATVKCWGFGSNGRLGQDSTDRLGDQSGEMAALDPVDLGVGRTATAVTAGDLHACALLDDGTVKCWGAGGSGRLGQGSTASLDDQPGKMAALNPVDLGVGRTATAVTAGYAHTCALLDNGTVKCWGEGSDGRLGQDSDTDVGDQPGELAALNPVNLGVGRTATAVTAGRFHTCALLDDATVTCWGDGIDGALGQDSTADLGDQAGEMAALNPVNLGAGRTSTAVTAGGGHTCALLDDATVKCWGAGFGGQLGQGSTDNWGDANGEMAALPAIELGRRAGVGAQARPDGHLRLGSGVFAGLDTYNTDGANQTRSTTVGSFGRATFTVRIENDGTYADTYRVKAAGSTTRYTVSYRRGTDITTQVISGAGYLTPEIRPGQTLDLTVTIKAKRAARRGNRIDRLVTITSLTDSTRTDAVKARVTRR